MLLPCWRPLGCSPLSPGRCPVPLTATLPSSQSLHLDFLLDWSLDLSWPFRFSGYSCQPLHLRTPAIPLSRVGQVTWLACEPTCMSSEGIASAIRHLADAIWGLASEIGSSRQAIAGPTPPSSFLWRMQQLLRASPVLAAELQQSSTRSTLAP